MKKIRIMTCATCIDARCPFKDQFKQAIEEAYPKVKVVFGTHGGPGGPEEVVTMFRGAIKHLLGQPGRSMVNLMNDVKTLMRGDRGKKH